MSRPRPELTQLLSPWITDSGCKPTDANLVSHLHLALRYTVCEFLLYYLFSNAVSIQVTALVIDKWNRVYSRGIGKRKLQYLEETCLIAILWTVTPTWTALWLNLALCIKKPMTNCLSYIQIYFYSPIHLYGTVLKLRWLYLSSYLYPYLSELSSFFFEEYMSCYRLSVTEYGVCRLCCDILWI